MKPLQSIINFFIVAFLILISVLVYQLVQVNNSNDSNNFSSGYCGTRDISNGVSSDVITKGKTLFKNYCATCHARNMVADATGPALENSLRKFNYDTLRYTQYLNDDAQFLKISTSNHIKHSNHKFNILTIQEVKSILEFIEGVSRF
ncbi:MAG: c-type cytochrome [Saprospiraceae bacterium]|nr:c-type cytochrome [Saprospiraceae bacterium]